MNNYHSQVEQEAWSECIGASNKRWLGPPKKDKEPELLEDDECIRCCATGQRPVRLRKDKSIAQFHKWITCDH